jgi:hypothetical protein
MRQSLRASTLTIHATRDIVCATRALACVSAHRMVGSRAVSGRLGRCVQLARVRSSKLDSDPCPHTWRLQAAAPLSRFLLAFTQTFQRIAEVEQTEGFRAFYRKAFNWEDP